MTEHVNPAGDVTTPGVVRGRTERPGAAVAGRGSLGRIWAVTLQDLRMVKADPSFLIIMVLMPLVAMAFLKGAFAPAMAQLGVPNANGSEQVVPGTAVTFSFFLVGNVGFVIFREHGWHTWVRLRASPASTSEILAGKILTPVLSSVLQLTVLFGVGAPLYGLTVQGVGMGAHPRVVGTGGVPHHAGPCAGRSVSHRDATELDRQRGHDTDGRPGWGADTLGDPAGLGTGHRAGGAQLLGHEGIPGGDHRRRRCGRRDVVGGNAPGVLGGVRRDRPDLLSGR
jgi:hypothetical protein